MTERLAGLGHRADLPGGGAISGGDPAEERLSALDIDGLEMPAMA
jgi:hypothetical protein